MRLVTYGDKSYALDNFGYLEHPSMWDEEFAEGIAPSLSIGDGLTPEHWRVIYHLRQHLDEKESVPFFVTTCIELGHNLEAFTRLFPTGFTRGACKAAGISFKFIVETNFALTYEHRPSILTRYQLSPSGYLVDFDAWDKTFANMIASEWDLPAGLTEAHWSVIRFIRDRFSFKGAVPVVYEICSTYNLTLDAFHKLFPTGYRRGACRIAGVPVPSSLDGA